MRSRNARLCPVVCVGFLFLSIRIRACFLGCSVMGLGKHGGATCFWSLLLCTSGKLPGHRCPSSPSWTTRSTSLIGPNTEAWGGRRSSTHPGRSPPRLFPFSAPSCATDTPAVEEPPFPVREEGEPRTQGGVEDLDGRHRDLEIEGGTARVEHGLRSPRVCAAF